MGQRLRALARRYSRWIGMSLTTLGVAGGVGVVDYLLRRFQHRQLFEPERFPLGDWRPERQGVSVHNVFFSTADGVRLHGWWLPRSDARATVLYFHGSAGNLAQQVERLTVLQRLPVHLFAFDYRGYGRSGGRPSEGGLFDDARAAWAHLTGELGQAPETVILHGHSLGGAVAVETALRHPAAGLVVQSSFTDVKEMARSLFPAVPLHWMARNQFRSIDKVGRLRLPKLFIHGTEDTKVPPEHTRALFAAASEPKELFWVEGAEHNDVHRRGGLAYLERLERFVAGCLADPVAPGVSPGVSGVPGVAASSP